MPHAPILSPYCAVDGCGRPRRVIDRDRGTRSRWCPAHARRRERDGDELADVPIGELKRVRARQRWRADGGREE